MSAVIVAQDLGRWYGPVVGLNELTLAIDGGVTGLVGPNGAGKSTFLKLVAGEIGPSRGSIRVLEHAPFANREYFRLLGYCPQYDALYDDLSGLEIVTLLMRMHGFARGEARRRANIALDRAGLAQGRERRSRGYSKGMRQRVKIAQAIAHEPRFLVFDEPLNGLDPLGRAAIGELFRELGRAGAHVLISSHVLHEVESITERIVLLHGGRLLAQGSVGDVRKLLDRQPRRVEIGVREPRVLARALLAFEHVTSVRVADAERRVHVETRDLDAFAREFTELAARERFGLERLESPDASLEAVFDYLVQ